MTVVRGLRGWIRILVIVLSARDTRAVEVDAGADDYVTEPFGMDELPARVRAAPAGDDPPVPATAAFTLDPVAKRVTTAAGEVRLTPTEWHSLEVLARRRGRLVPQRQLPQQVWGPAYCTETNCLRVHLANLRRKLEPDPSRPRCLITEEG